MPKRCDALALLRFPADAYDSRPGRSVGRRLESTGERGSFGPARDVPRVLHPRGTLGGSGRCQRRRSRAPPSSWDAQGGERSEPQTGVSYSRGEVMPTLGRGAGGPPRPRPSRCPRMSTCWYHHKKRNRPEGRSRAQFMEATTGFEPVNRGFADLRVEPLHHVAELAAPRGFEPRFTDPKSAVLPLDEGAAGVVQEQPRGYPGQRNGAEDGTRTRDPHLGKVMLYQLSHFRSMCDHRSRWCREPDSNWRHRDFQSRALPTELSRPDGQPGFGRPSAEAG
jgi:hypothetical protein